MKNKPVVRKKAATGSSTARPRHWSPSRGGATCRTAITHLVEVEERKKKRKKPGKLLCFGYTLVHNGRPTGLIYKTEAELRRRWAGQYGAVMATVEYRALAAPHKKGKTMSRAKKTEAWKKPGDWPCGYGCGWVGTHLHDAIVHEEKCRLGKKTKKAEAARAAIAEAERAVVEAAMAETAAETPSPCPTYDAGLRAARRAACTALQRVRER